MSLAQPRRVERRRLVVAVATCLLTLGLAAATPAAGHMETAVAPHPAPSASAPAPTEFVLGVNVDLLADDAMRLERTVDRISSAGVGAVRLPVHWAEVEPAPGAFRWQRLDAVAAALARRGVRLLVTIASAPAWARHDPTPEAHIYLCQDHAALEAADAREAPPTDAAPLARFAAQLAQRYRGRLWAVEVWSEPNLLPHWRRTGPDPEDYARLLREVAAAVRAAAPEVRIVSGALAPTVDIGVCYLSDTVFLDRLARSGVLAEVDAVGIEPFGLRSPPRRTPSEPGALEFARAAALHDVLARLDVDRPLWALAWGWNAAGAGVDTAWGSHDPGTVAAWLGEGYAIARSDWPWLGAMFVWHYRPVAASGDPIWGFALEDRDGRATVLWDAVARMARDDHLDGGAPTARSGVETPEVVAIGTPRGHAAEWALVLVAALTLGAAALRLRARVARAGAPALARCGMLDPAAACAAYASLALVNVAVPLWPVASLALAPMIVIGAAHPLVALAAVAASVPFAGTVPMHVATRPVWPVELLVSLALVAAGWRWYVAPLESRRSCARAVDCCGQSGAAPRWRGTATERFALRIRHSLDPLDGAVIAIVAWAALTPLWAEHPLPAIREWRTVILEPALLYALLRAAPDRRRAARAAIAGLVIGGVVAALWALLGVGLYLAGRTGAAVAAEGVVRANGPYRSPNNLALYLGRLLPAIAACAIWGSARARRVCGLLAVPIGAALLATFSRGAIVLGVPVTVVSLAVAGSARLRRAGWRRLVASGALVVVLAGVVLVPLADTPRVRDVFAPRPGSTLYIRWRLWQSAVEMGRDHPVLGVGLDNFLYLYRDRYVRRDAAQERFLSHPHNVLLDWWTRLGLPGLALLAAMVVGQWRAARRAWRGPRPDHALIVAAGGMQIYALAHGLVDNSFFLVDLAITWWIAQAALIAAAGPRDSQRAAA